MIHRRLVVGYKGEGDQDNIPDRLLQKFIFSRMLNVISLRLLSYEKTNVIR